MTFINNLTMLIKKAALDAVEATKPACFRFGTVQTVQPLTVKLSDKLTLDSSVLVIPLRLKNAFQVGDKLIVFQNKGGQQFLIMDKAVT